MADRIERRKILLMSQWVQMASAGMLTIVVMGLQHVADFVPLFLYRDWRRRLAVSVPGTDSDAGRSRGHAQRDCIEFNSVQPGGYGGSGLGWDHAGEIRREVVLWAECGFVYGADYFTVVDHGAVLACDDDGVDVQQSEAGDQVCPQAGLHGGSGRAGFYVLTFYPCLFALVLRL